MTKPGTLEWRRERLVEIARGLEVQGYINDGGVVRNASVELGEQQEQIKALTRRLADSTEFLQAMMDDEYLAEAHRPEAAVIIEYNGDALSPTQQGADDA